MPGRLTPVFRGALPVSCKLYGEKQPIDIVTAVLTLMWACLTATIVVYALRPVAAGRRARAIMLAVAALAFAGGYAAHQVPQPRGAAAPNDARFAALDLSRVPLESVPALGAIDRVARTPRFIDIAGWAADGVRSRSGAGIFLLVDGTQRSRASSGDYGGARPDVAGVFNDANLLWVGYGIRYVPSGLAPGNHYLQIAVVSDDFKHAYILPQHVAFAMP
jgi:hypothetical protein